MAKISDKTTIPNVPNILTATSKTTFYIVSGLVILALFAGFLGGWKYSQMKNKKSNNYTATNQTIVTQTEQDIVNNKIVTSDTLSDKQAEIIKADEIKTEPLKTEATQITTAPSITQKTYTNQFLPNFKIVYPSDWEFTTTTSPSFSKDLVTRDIKLSKNGTELEIKTMPVPVWGCGGGATEPSYYNISHTTKSGYKEISWNVTMHNNKNLFYTTNIDCEMIKESSIPQKSLSDYELTPSEQGVYFIIDISTNIDSSTASTNKELAEIRQIIENSSF